jgi:ubiquinone/menaquinone biosynthesis C-methylase UbiE
MDVVRAYDALNGLLFASAGGSRRLRRRFVDLLGISPGDRVLELGCGTGQVTEAVLAAGADVVAVDALAEMLDRARQRAPAAVFVHGDALQLPFQSSWYDHAVIAFVLHNLAAEDRRQLLARAVDAVHPGAQIDVLDWALPEGLTARPWQWLLGVLEPSQHVREVLRGDLPADLAAAGLALERRQSLAGGRVQVLLARAPELGRRPDVGCSADEVAAGPGAAT